MRVPPRPPARCLPSAVLLVAAIAAACAPAPPVQPSSSRPPGKASPRPSASPGAAASATPASPAASGGLSPSPAASPTASPRATLVDQVANKLLNLAKLGFNQSRSQLAAKGDVATAGLLGNNSAGVISNNAGSLISDKGLGLVANNGGSVVANNGAGLTSKTKHALAPYGLLQATALPTLPPSVTIETTARPGETLTQRRVFPDGVVSLRFSKPTEIDPDAYRLVSMRDGKPFREYISIVTARWPDGGKRLTEGSSTDIYGDGALAGHFEIHQDTEDATGLASRISVQPGSFLRDVAGGAGALIEQLELDLPAQTGTFRYVYPPLGLVEAGTLTGVVRDGSGVVPIAYWDPLAAFDGTAVGTVDGVVVYKRTVAKNGTTKTTTFDLNDGLSLTLTPATPEAGAKALRLDGRLSQDGAGLADVRLEVAPEGTSKFTITFDADPAAPVVVGYGAEGLPAPVASPPATPAALTTILGRGGRGYADGLAPLAKFEGLGDLAASRKRPGVYYLLDQGGNRLRVLDMATQTVGTVAGDGTAGYQDGPAAAARFALPRGLAVAADDTIYVSDRDNVRIRVVAPDGTVSTLAGSGTKAYAEGTGAAASFNGPTGLAIDAAGALYVADYYNHRIRRVGTQGPDLGVVTTLAGTGDGGLLDGPAAEARFKGPIALAFGPDGDLYVADAENARIRKVAMADPTHPVTTVVGTSDPARKGMDGAALETGIEAPRDLMFDPEGRLTFLSLLDVRQLGADGQVRTLVGTGLVQHADGPAFMASLGAGNALAFLADAGLLVADGPRVSLLTKP